MIGLGLNGYLLQLYYLIGKIIEKHRDKNVLSFQQE